MTYKHIKTVLEQGYILNISYDGEDFLAEIELENDSLFEETGNMDSSLQLLDITCHIHLMKSQLPEGYKIISSPYDELGSAAKKVQPEDLLFINLEWYPVSSELGQDINDHIVARKEQ